MINSSMFSSATDEWATPQQFFDKLNSIYKFEIDVCATSDNAKCEKYFTRDEDGLQQEWTGSCWMNPPYGRAIKHWIKKACDAGLSGHRVVCLLPARTDTAWFHDFCLPHGKIEFIRGRLKFGGAKTSAPFPSMIVIFGD